MGQSAFDTNFKQILTSSMLLTKASCDCTSFCMRFNCGIWSDTLSCTYVKQYLPLNSSFGAFTFRHWSKSPYWFMLPFKMPEGILADASSTVRVYAKWEKKSWFEIIIIFATQIEKKKTNNQTRLSLEVNRARKNSISLIDCTIWFLQRRVNVFDSTSNCEFRFLCKGTAAYGTQIVVIAHGRFRI